MPIITVPGPVEIDECHIGAKIRGKVGRPPAPGKIVFGIKCRTTGISLLFPVPNKSKEVLLPILIEHVEEGAQVISYKYSSYVTRFGRSHLEEVGFDHYFVNHSLHFVGLSFSTFILFQYIIFNFFSMISLFYFF